MAYAQDKPIRMQTIRTSFIFWKLAGSGLLVLSTLLPSGSVISAELETYSNQVDIDFSLPDLKGKTHTLSDYKGKVVLVNFWASWCLPCIKEMPAMRRLADSLDDEDFELLTLNISDSPKRIKETLKRIQLDMAVLLDDDGKIFKAWQGDVLPTSYLLDSTGQLRYRVIGPTEWDNEDVSLKVKELIQTR